MDIDKIISHLNDTIELCDYIIKYHNYGLDRQSNELLAGHKKQARFLKDALEYEQGDYDIHI